MFSCFLQVKCKVKVNVKVKVKSLCLTNQHTMKMYRGSGGICPSILNLGTRWRSASRSGRFTPRDRAPDTHLDRRLGGPQSRSGHDGKKNSQPLLGLEL
jgi:hypothetical protein